VAADLDNASIIALVMGAGAVLAIIRGKLAFEHLYLQNTILDRLILKAARDRDFVSVMFHEKRREELPSLYTMVLMFWIWPMKRFGEIDINDVELF
jgi:hypothetical protein